MNFATSTTHLDGRLICLRVEFADAVSSDSAAADITNLLRDILEPDAAVHFVSPNRVVIIGVSREIYEFEVPVVMYTLKECRLIRAVSRERLFATSFSCDEI
jgi:hypothetical protein